MRYGLAVLLAVVASLVPTAASSAAEWDRYADPAFGFSVAVPDDGFDLEQHEAGVTLVETDGGGRIDIYALRNEAGLTIDDIRGELARAERIKEITYSRGGESWLVVSGYYERSDEEPSELIFYAKFMLSADRRSFSAFEASYPVADKDRFDPIIEAMEDTLTRPGS